MLSITAITLQVDRRITLADLKQKLEVYVGQPSNQFRIFRVYSNSQEFEVTRLDDTLTTYSDDTKLVVKFGRALAKGEYRVKVFELQVNNPEVQKTVNNLISTFASCHQGLACFLPLLHLLTFCCLCGLLPVSLLWVGYSVDQVSAHTVVTFMCASA